MKFSLGCFRECDVICTIDASSRLRISMAFLVYGVLRCSSSSNKTLYSAWLLDAATGIIPERASLVFDRERAKATKAVDQTSRSSQLDTDLDLVSVCSRLCMPRLF